MEQTLPEVLLLINNKYYDKTQDMALKHKYHKNPNVNNVSIAYININTRISIPTIITGTFDDNEEQPGTHTLISLDDDTHIHIHSGQEMVSRISKEDYERVANQMKERKSGSVSNANEVLVFDNPDDGIHHIEYQRHQQGIIIAMVVSRINGKLAILIQCHVLAELVDKLWEEGLIRVGAVIEHHVKHDISLEHPYMDYDLIAKAIQENIPDAPKEVVYYKPN